MKIEQIMTRSIVTVEMDDTLKVVKDIFDHASFHHLLVVEDGRLYGIISDRDLLKTLSPNIGTLRETSSDLAMLNRKAHQIMTRKPITIPADADIATAVDIFTSQRISCIPVVDSDDRPIGIVSLRDMLKAVCSEMKTRL